MLFYRITRILLLVGACVVISALSLAAPDAKPRHKFPHFSTNNYLNTADLAVLATVTKVVLPQASAANANNAPDGRTYALVTMKIDKMLIGKYSDGETVSLPIQCIQSLTPDGLHWIPNIPTNKPMLFALKREKFGYALTVPGTAMSPAENLTKWEFVQGEIPLTMSAPKVQGVIAFGKKTTITVLLKNPQDEPINITDLSLSGFFLSKKLDSYVSLYPGADEVPKLGKPLLLEAKSEKEVTMHVTATPPLAWGLFKPDCLLATPVAIRVVAHVGKAPDIGSLDYDTYNSPLTLTTAGFTPAKFD